MGNSTTQTLQERHSPAAITPAAVSCFPPHLLRHDSLQVVPQKRIFHERIVELRHGLEERASLGPLERVWGHLLSPLCPRASCLPLAAGGGRHSSRGKHPPRGQPRRPVTACATPERLQHPVHRDLARGEERKPTGCFIQYRLTEICSIPELATEYTRCRSGHAHRHSCPVPRSNGLQTVPGNSPFFSTLLPTYCAGFQPSAMALRVQLWSRLQRRRLFKLENFLALGSRHLSPLTDPHPPRLTPLSPHAIIHRHNHTKPLQETCWSCHRDITSRREEGEDGSGIRFFCPCEKRVVLPPSVGRNYFEIMSWCVLLHCCV